MADNLIVTAAHFNEQLRALQTSDPAHPDTWNPSYLALLENDHWLRDLIIQTQGQIDDAQQDLDAIGVDGQNALWSAVERAISEVGLLHKEMDRQQTVRHQEGVVTLINRGVKTGCTLSKSTTANRNIGIDAGKCFMHGQVMPVASEENAASVPSNSGTESATAQAYLTVIDNSVQLAVTNLGEEAPDDALVLAELSIPAGSDGTSAPYLDDVTITTVARTEPGWPTVQTSPAFVQKDFAKLMDGSDYHLSLDVVDYLGGERPVITRSDDDRASNTFRVYLAGSADSVRTRFVAHLMNQ